MDTKFCIGGKEYTARATAAKGGFGGYSSCAGRLVSLAEQSVFLVCTPLPDFELPRHSIGSSMCGRFTQSYTWREISDLYELFGAPRNLQAHYNIAPTDTVEVVKSGNDGANHLVPMRWGLIPAWWKKTVKDVPATFNARAETVADKPMFRDAFKRGRCIIPASGYYEWKSTVGGKQPYFISAADGGVLSFAGLWDRWRNPATGELVMSCTIIVTDANTLTGAIHDRMPVVLEEAAIKPWLTGAANSELLLKPAKDGRLRMWPVSQRVNRTGSGDDDPTLIEVSRSC
jgi:putative SOS response-associated peptidase YedK